MPDFLSGSAFQIRPTAATRGMNVETFMKAMGGTLGNAEEVDFEPMQPMDQALQTNTPDHEVYVRSMTMANNFGMQMAAKGIDVLNPKTQEGARAASEFNRMWKKAIEAGNGVRAGHEIAKLYTEQRLKEGVFGPPLPQDKTYTFEDLQGLINTNPFAKRLSDAVDQINGMARDYTTQSQADQANATIEGKVNELESLYDPMLKSGVPENIARFLIDNAKNSINRAAYDPSKEMDRELRASRIRSQNLTDATRRQKLRAEAGKKNKIELMQQRKKLIMAVQQGSPQYVESLVGGQIGKVKIENVQLKKDEWGEISGLIINKDETAKGTIDKTKNIEIPMTEDNNYGWAAINNILNTAPGNDDFSFEELSLVPDPTSPLQGVNELDIVIPEPGDKTFVGPMPGKMSETIPPRISELEKTLNVTVPKGGWIYINKFYKDFGRIPTELEYNEIKKHFGF